ncbi:leucyl aminopeptidase [Rhodothalassium salexigens]|uniref:leucyl aminopeptidase n=1 Tax=Rhodothalassium salexigens TaxID=1086 RepID=UPI00191206DD|nr:leucyl aminopeptidase [Rhodothalassium salexigens]MBK5911597.1 leucyl aminopeptidase [Rhodothalassium salexigens]MBK5920890.1 leucyl aminopeptidase [Rhodothalassium salexigens]
MDVKIEKPALPKAGTLAVFARGERLTRAAREADDATGGALTRAVQASSFAGKKSEMIDLLVPQGLDVDRLVLVGLGDDGDPGDLKTRDFAELGGKLVARLSTGGTRALTIALDDDETGGVPAHEAAAELAFGAQLRAWRFDKYRTKEPAEKKPTLKSVVVTTDAQGAAAVRFADLSAVADGVAFTRELTSEPANVLTPAGFAERMERLAALGCSVAVYGENELEEMGFRALLAVGQGSVNESKLVVVKWAGKSGAGAEMKEPLALIGKGVTFDSGGISIKPAENMDQMKWDMGGAGIVAGTLYALAKRRAKVDVVGVIGLVENMPSGAAYRPGDVLETLSGQTVEVINTDAEGRLVLADCLWHAKETMNPAAMIDFATLTGAAIVGLGHHHAALLTDEEALATGLFEAGQVTGDRVWRLPLDKDYDKQIDSQIADMKNTGGRSAGTITAAQFLKRYVGETPWAHVDVAGMVWSDKDGDLWEKGATGFGVRLMDRFVAETYEV